jgi:hypothetical protein
VKQPDEDEALDRDAKGLAGYLSDPRRAKLLRNIKEEQVRVSASKMGTRDSLLNNMKCLESLILN